jgi:hypothetical protein
MLLKIEKRGHRMVITNNPPIKYQKFTIQINENDIIEQKNEDLTYSIANENIHELLEMREKYPQLHAIDLLTSDWTNEINDHELLEEYFKQRAKDKGII